MPIGENFVLNCLPWELRMPGRRGGHQKPPPPPPQPGRSKHSRKTQATRTNVQYAGMVDKFIEVIKKRLLEMHVG